VLDAGNPFFTDVARGAEEAAAEIDAAVLLGNSAQDPVREAHYLDLFDEQRLRGVLISPVGDVAERLHRLRARGTAAVIVDGRAGLTAFPSVSVDDVAGGRLAVEHLLSVGRRHIAFMGGPFSLQQVRDRLTGARQAMESSTASLEVLEIPQLTVIQGREAGNRLLRRPVSEWPDAIFAANDLVAMGVLQALMLTSSVRVPDQIALIGYDDIDFASAAVVPISSVRQPRELLGRTAVDLVEEPDEADGSPRHVVFQPELVVRASTLLGT
jgi:LacI family transcriptional regulator